VATGGSGPTSGTSAIDFGISIKRPPAYRTEEPPRA
jgi:hypothetical protein